MDRARGTGAATRGGPGAGTAARGGPGAGREGGGVRDSPGARPRRSPRYRGAFTRPARWHGASARSRPAQRAISPQQWSQRAISPQQWSQRAGTPQQWSQRAICRHGLHGQPPPLSFVALRTLICVEGAPGSRSSQPQAAHGTRAHASSHLGRLCVSCATCQCSDVGRPPTREGAVLPRRPRAPSTRQAGAQKGPAPRGCGPTKAGCESISRQWK